MTPGTDRIPLICFSAILIAASLAVVATTWLIVPIDNPAGFIVTIAVTIAGASGIYAAFGPIRGRDPDSSALWVEIGILAAVAIPTIFSIGILYLLATVWTATALAIIPRVPGHPWLRDRDILVAASAFIATETPLLFLLLR